MIALPKDAECCGCGVCSIACRFGALEMGNDRNGFKRPLIDKDKCKNCGVCTKVCPVINCFCFEKPVKVLAVKSRDDELRNRSASGGASVNWRGR